MKILLALLTTLALVALLGSCSEPTHFSAISSPPTPAPVPAEPLPEVNPADIDECPTEDCELGDDEEEFTDFCVELDFEVMDGADLHRALRALRDEMWSRFKAKHPKFKFKRGFRE